MMQKIVRMANDTCPMNYTIHHPAETAELPLLVYLHGAGERGMKVEHLDRQAIPTLLSQGKEYPAVVLCPQCPGQLVWDNVVVELKQLIDAVAAEFAIKPDRIVLTGSSMGGFGTWVMGLTYRNYFAAIAPLAGGGMSWRTANLRTTPVWALHGEKDTTVPPVYSQLMVDGVNKNGGNARLTLVEGMGHNDGINYAYEHMGVIEWLLAQRRTDFSYVPEVMEHKFG
jgi:predicted peptidase